MPSIGQPGRVASDKNTANEILDALTTDQTEFSGGNIDAAVSSRATPADTGSGVDWSSKTPASKEVAGVSASGTGDTVVLSVTGSGYLFQATIALDDQTSVISGDLRIDGTRIGSKTINPTAGTGSAEFTTTGNTRIYFVEYRGMFRFESSFELIVNIDVSQSRTASAECDFVRD